MTELAEVAPAFLEMAHRIVWCSAATVDAEGRPWSRVLHPIWVWEGGELVGWIGTGPTPLKRAHLEAHPHVSVNYWDPSQDTCVAECDATWAFDDATCTKVWNLLKDGPPPVGYDPAIIPVWNEPTDDTFAALRLDPWRLRVSPASVLMGNAGDLMTWRR